MLFSSENEEGARGGYNRLILKQSLIVANMLAEITLLLTLIGRWRIIRLLDGGMISAASTYLQKGVICRSPIGQNKKGRY